MVEFYERKDPMEKRSQFVSGFLVISRRITFMLAAPFNKKISPA
jgi:hypothetical protein